MSAAINFVIPARRAKSMLGDDLYTQVRSAPQQSIVRHGVVIGLNSTGRHIRLQGSFEDLVHVIGEDTVRLIAHEYGIPIAMVPTPAQQQDLEDQRALRNLQDDANREAKAIERAKRFTAYRNRLGLTIG